MLGCNGRGVALATIYGRELARHASAALASDFVLPKSAPKRIWLHALVPALIKYAALRDAVEVRRLERR
jgi:hypothetical protein